MASSIFCLAAAWGRGCNAAGLGHEAAFPLGQRRGQGGLASLQSCDPKRCCPWLGVGGLGWDSQKQLVQGRVGAQGDSISPPRRAHQHPRPPTPAREERVRTKGRKAGQMGVSETFDVGWRRAISGKKNKKIKIGEGAPRGSADGSRLWM